MTIDIAEEGTKEIVHKISEGNYLPDLFELWIDNIEPENEDVNSLLTSHRSKLDALYFNYNVSEDYKTNKVDINPYFEGILNCLDNVRDRVRLRCFKMTAQQMVKIFQTGKHLSKF
jgi:hypothetical protein